MNMLIYVASLPYARPAVLFGGLVACLTGSSVTLLHVAPPNEGSSAAEGVLAQAHALLSGVVVDTRIRQGSPVRSITAEIESGDYDLIVLRARRTLGLTDLLRGTVGRAIAEKSPIPVLVVKRGRPDLRRVLICTGGTDVAEPVIELGARLAQAAHAQATLLHVAHPIPSMYTGLDTMEETMTELLQADTPLAQHLRHATGILSHHQVDARLELRRGDVADEIIREAHIGDYDLVIVGASEAKRGLKEWVLGNVTRRVVDAVRCPVLVVR